MADILIVEGLTDATFFQEVISRFYLTEPKRLNSDLPGRRNMPSGVKGITRQGVPCEIEFRYLLASYEAATGGKGQIPAIIRTLLDEGVSDFSVARDFDRDSREQVLQSIADVVYSHLKTSVPRDIDPSGRITTDEGIISVLPMGLVHSPTLDSLGVTNHSIEDFLIEMMFEDPSLRKMAPELKPLLEKLLPLIRDADGPFDSSKELFQLIKPIVQHSFSDTGVVKKAIGDAKEDVLRAVMAPLLSDMELAFGF